MGLKSCLNGGVGGGGEAHHVSNLICLSFFANNLNFECLFCTKGGGGGYHIPWPHVL